MLTTSTPIILENFSLFDGVSDEIEEGLSLVIDGEQIVEVSNGAVRLESARRIDCLGGFLMPGLIDAHFHAYLITGDMRRLDRMPLVLRAFLAARTLEGALLRGFTSVRDVGGGDVGLHLATEQGHINGPRFFFGGKALSQTGGHGDMRLGDQVEPCGCAYSGVIARTADGADDVRKHCREELRKGADHIKIFVSGGVLSPTDPIWMRQFTDDEIRAAVDEAATRRKYVAAHCHTDEAARRCVRLGVRSIEHGTEIFPDTAELIATSGGCYVVPTLSVLEQLRAHGPQLELPAATLEKSAGLADQMRSSIENCTRAGVKLGLGTDLVGTEYQSMQGGELALRAQVSRPIDVLRSATSTNAEILQMPGKLGVVRPDALADLILIEGNPLLDLSVFSAPASAMPLIMRGGRLIKCSL